MTLRPINPPGSTIPGISQAMVVESGRLMLLSGHVPMKNDGTVAGTQLQQQLTQVFENMEATLRAAGAGFEHVARLTLYVRDYQPDVLPVIRTVRDRFVDAQRPPASALIGVASLFHPDVLVEVDAVAVLPSGT